RFAERYPAGQPVRRDVPRSPAWVESFGRCTSTQRSPMMGLCGWRWPLTAVRCEPFTDRDWMLGRKMTGKRVLGIVLAGGAGSRLAPLTAHRPQAAVPFGGLYRLVDFVLSNLVNAGIRRICVLTQYKSHSLDRHLGTAWRLSSLLDDYVMAVPAQQRLGPHWQAGSADAIYQSLNLIDRDRPDLVVVAGADHVYRMDPAQMIGQHTARGAGVTVAALPVPRMQAACCGVVQAAPDGHRI